MPRSRPARCSGCVARCCLSIRACSSPRPTPSVRSTARRTTTTQPCDGSRDDSGPSCFAVSGLPPATSNRLCDAGPFLPHNSPEDVLPSRQCHANVRAGSRAGLSARARTLSCHRSSYGENGCRPICLWSHSKAAARPSLAMRRFPSCELRGSQLSETPIAHRPESWAGEQHGGERMDNNTKKTIAKRCTPGSPACGRCTLCPEPLRVSGHRIQDGAR